MHIIDLCTHITTLNYDSLRDLKHIIDNETYNIKPHRGGLKPYYELAGSSISQLYFDHIAALDLIDLHRLRSLIRQVMVSKSPSVNASSEGYFETKTKVKNRIINGNVEEIELKYLYLRAYTASPYALQSGKKSRLASIYIGSLNGSLKPFVLAVLDNEITARDILKRYEQGGYTAIRDWRKRYNGD